jgi:putative tricarboxylic transport membrane protein
MTKKTKKSFWAIVAVVVMLSFPFGTTNLFSADEFPSKPISLIITVNPGSSSDVFARMLAKATEDATGHKFVCKNKPGGGHAIGISYVLSQPADGHTIFSQTATLAYSLATGKLPFGANDLQPIVMATTDHVLLIVNSESEIQNYEDFIATAKKKNLKIGMVGNFSNNAMLAEAIETQAGIDITNVPYAGGSKVRMAILGSNVDAAILSSGNIRKHLKKGKLRALATFSAERDQFGLKDIPTLNELGYDIEYVHWRGVLTGKNVPKDRVAKLASMFEQGMQTQRWKDYLAKHEQTGAFRDTKAFTKIFLDGADVAKTWMATKK